MIPGPAAAGYGAAAVTDVPIVADTRLRLTRPWWPAVGQPLPQAWLTLGRARRRSVMWMRAP